MSRRICCLRKSDYTTHMVVDYPYLMVVVNGRRMTTPKGQNVVIPADEFQVGTLDAQKCKEKGLEFKPVMLTDKQIQRSHVIGVDEMW